MAGSPVIDIIETGRGVAAEIGAVAELSVGEDEFAWLTFSERQLVSWLLRISAPLPEPIGEVSATA